MTGTFKNQSLDSVNKKLVKAGEALKEVTAERADCLRTFIECQTLVEWLQEKMSGIYTCICEIVEQIEYLNLKKFIHLMKQY